jgi:hypothetical protein
MSSWKGLNGTNTLAYYENLQITDVKSFITLAPDMMEDNIHIKLLQDGTGNYKTQ